MQSLRLLNDDYSVHVHNYNSIPIDLHAHNCNTDRPIRLDAERRIGLYPYIYVPIDYRPIYNAYYVCNHNI